MGGMGGVLHDAVGFAVASYKDNITHISLLVIYSLYNRVCDK